MPVKSDEPLRKVTLNGECIEYDGSRTEFGHGQFWFEGVHWHAHRYSYTVHKGPIPKGMQVRHTCDNPPCINPEHLVLGTQQDNINDCIARGRRYKHDRMITEQQLEEIRNLRMRGATYKELGEMYGVSRQTIYRYVSGQMSCQ